MSTWDASPIREAGHEGACIFPAQTRGGGLPLYGGRTAGSAAIHAMAGTARQRSRLFHAYATQRQIWPSRDAGEYSAWPRHQLVRRGQMDVVEARGANNDRRALGGGAAVARLSHRQ